jgi:hypothetical protein
MGSGYGALQAVKKLALEGGLRQIILLCGAVAVIAGATTSTFGLWQTYQLDGGDSSFHVKLHCIYMHCYC